MTKLASLLMAMFLALSAANISGINITAQCYMEHAGSITVDLYHAGQIKDGKIVLDDAYVGIRAPDTNSSKQLMECASSIYARVAGSNVKPDYSVITDTSGRARFTDIKSGIYCVASKKQMYGNRIYSIIPVLVFADKDNIDIELKMNIEVPDRNDTVSVSVKKKWVLSEKSEAVPVTVCLLRNGVSVDNVTLSDENDWTYTWTDLDKNYVWTAAECDIPSGFVAEISGNGDAFIITNTAVETFRASPQTGLGTHNIIMACVLFAVIIMLLVVIIFMIRKENEEK